MAENRDRNQELVTSVETGNLDQIKIILDCNRSLYCPGHDLLATALTNKHMEVVKELLNRNFSCDQKHLNLAVLHANVEVLQMIRIRVCRRVQRKRGDYSCGNDYKKKIRALHAFVQRHPVDEECQRVLNLLLKIKGSSINIVHTPSGYIAMHFAAECGNAEIIPLLLSAKSHINGKTHKNQTPLHLAAANGHAETVRVLLKHGAKSNLKNKDNRTALCLAVKNEDLPTIEAFLETTRRINTDPMVVYCAVETQNVTIIEKILGKGGNPNIPSSESGKTALHLAVENGFQEIVSLLLQYKANPNAVQVENGFTALHIATEKEQIEIFQLLLNKRAEPEAKDKFNRTGLHLATENGSLALVTAFLKSGCEVISLFTQEAEKGYTPLHIAVENGHEDFVRLFLDAGIPVSLTTQGEFMPIHLAARKGNSAMVKLLLEYDADPSSGGPTFIETPLFLAAQAGSIKIVGILSELTTNRKDIWIEGYVSLFIAAFHGHEIIVKMLLNKGVDPNSYFKNILTPLTAAAQQGHQNIVNILLEHQAEVNHSPKEVEENTRFLTPLIAACLSGHKEIVEILLHRGADINVKIASIPQSMQHEVASLLMYGNSSYSELLSKKFLIGYMPIHFGAASGKKIIVEMLVNHGADVNASAEKKEELRYIEENIATPLCLAVYMQHEDVVTYLLESGAIINADKSGSLLLFAAILQKNHFILDLLLKHNAPYLNFTYSYCEMNDFTPLNLAVMFSSVEVVEALLEKGLLVDIISELDFPLHNAVQKNDQGIMYKLIEYGACLDSVCSQELSTIFHAVAAHNTDAVKALAKKGASFNLTTTSESSLLHFSLNKSLDEEMIKLIVECGVDVNKKSQNNLAPIERIIYRKRHYNSEDTISYYNLDHILKIFLKDGLDVNSRLSDNEETILHYATYNRNQERVKLLLQHDADINLLNKQGHTPFFYALQNQTELSYPIILEVARTEAKGGFVHPENHSLMKSNPIKDYYSNCKIEIEEMKKCKITSQVSFFNILIAGEANLAVYAKNVNIVKVMDSSELKLLFPLYHEYLKVRFGRGLARKKLLEVSHEILNEILNRELPNLIVNKMFKNLTCIDLKNLCRAKYPIMFLSSTNTKE